MNEIHRAKDENDNLVQELRRLTGVSYLEYRVTFNFLEYLDEMA